MDDHLTGPEVWLENPYRLVSQREQALRKGHMAGWLLLTAVIVVVFVILLAWASVAEAQPLVPIPLPPSEGGGAVVMVEARWLSPAVLEARARGERADGMPLAGAAIRWADLTGCDVHPDCLVDVHEARTGRYGVWTAKLEAGKPWMVSATQPAFRPVGWCRSGVDTWRVEAGGEDKYRFLVEFWGNGCF